MTEDNKDDVETRRIVRMVLGGLTLSHFGTENFDPIYFGRVLAIPFMAGLIKGSTRRIARIASQEYLGDTPETNYSDDAKGCFKDIRSGLEFRIKQLRQQERSA